MWFYDQPGVVHRREYFLKIHFIPFFSVWMFSTLWYCLPCGFCALSVIPSLTRRSQPMMLVVCFSTNNILHCLTDSDFISKWSTPLFRLLLLLKHQNFVFSLYWCLFAHGMMFVSSLSSAVFINNRGDPVAANHSKFSWFVDVSTQTPP